MYVAFAALVLGFISFLPSASAETIVASPTRAQVSQIEQLNAVIQTFYNKYGGLPGDLENGKEFFPHLENGNGDELITGEEAESFWKYMVIDSQMIPDDLRLRPPSTWTDDDFKPHPPGFGGSRK